MIEEDFYYDEDIEEPEQEPNPGASWYKTDNINETYYSPYTKTKREYSYLNPDGPNGPKDIVENLNSNSNLEFEADGNFFVDWGKKSLTKEVILPGGCYSYAQAASPTPERLIPIELRLDGYLNLKEDFVKEVEGDIERFIQSEEMYKEHDMFFKLGILMFGEPGNSKTVTIRKILKEIAPKDAIVIFLDDVLPSTGFLLKIKNSLSDRFKFLIFEELVSSTSNRRQTNKLLDFLDGESSIDRCVIIATTNYPQNLPENIVSRPSRLDKIYEFLPPNSEQRKELLKFFLKTSDVKEEWINSCKDMSIASIKEICTSILTGKFKSFDQATKVLKDRSALIKRCFAKTSDKFGF